MYWFYEKKAARQLNERSDGQTVLGINPREKLSNVLINLYAFSVLSSTHAPEFSSCRNCVAPVALWYILTYQYEKNAVKTKIAVVSTPSPHKTENRNSKSFSFYHASCRLGVYDSLEPFCKLFLTFHIILTILFPFSVFDSFRKS